MSESETLHRHDRIKSWKKVERDAAVLSGEVGRRGARVIERYLDDRISDQGRRLKMMCRAGCLPVLATIGTGMKWPVSLRACMLCKTGQTDSILHLLVACPAFERCRKVLKTKAARSLEGIGPDKATWFHALPETDLCDVLLGKSVGNARIDDFIDVLVKRYLTKIWNGRKRLQRAVQDVIGWQWLKKV